MPLKVIGAGLGRTGTMSLKLALEQIGFGPCYHMVEVFKLGTAPTWARAFRGEKMDWEAVFDGFPSTVDWPGCDFYAELAELYPEAKVILSLRDPESWYRSTQETIFRDISHEDADAPWREMFELMVGNKFGGDIHSHDHLIEVYNRHNDEVRRTIAPERLLEYQPGDGWEPLCDFLGVPVPDAPYPKVNSTEEFKGRVEARRQARGAAS
jgi:hypothetical protein